MPVRPSGSRWRSTNATGCASRSRPISQRPRSRSRSARITASADSYWRGEGWHEGVKGIVASRLTNLYRVPSILFTIEDGVARGSGRSVGTVDLFRALEACSSVLTRFGGHAAAVGCTLPAEKIDEFRACFIAHLDTLPAEQFASETMVDAEVELEDVSVELGAEFALLEPFGHGNRQPLLASRGVFMNGRSKVGKTGNHLRFSAYDGAVTVPAIAFRCRDIDALVGHESAVDLAYELSVDEWRGKTRVQLMVREFHHRPASADAPAYELVEDLFAHADEILAREEYAGIEDAPSFHTKLAGVTFEGRQDVLGASGRRLAAAPRAPARESVRCQRHRLVRSPRGAGRLLQSPSRRGARAGDRRRSRLRRRGDGSHRGRGRPFARRERAWCHSETARRPRTSAARSESAAGLSSPRCRPPSSTPRSRARSSAIGALHDAQAESLARLAAGECTLTVMATGRGKSLIFHMHAARTALLGGKASVFVYPLRALVADQAFHLSEAFRGRRADRSHRHRRIESRANATTRSRGSRPASSTSC